MGYELRWSLIVLPVGMVATAGSDIGTLPALAGIATVFYGFRYRGPDGQTAPHSGEHEHRASPELMSNSTVLLVRGMVLLIARTDCETQSVSK